MLQSSETARVKNIVLVHGGFVDGSGWEGVYQTLKKNGYTVTVVQNPTTTLADDVAFTRRALAEQDGPAILVGHSYGGVVITEAGTDPKVAGLVYIAAFAPDTGESVLKLIENPPPGAPVPPILPPQDGYLFLDRAKFAASFAADVEPSSAAFMADSQVPWGVDALAGAVTSPAWKTQAELVSGRDRGPDDSAGCPARDVEACGCNSRRGAAAVTRCTCRSRKRSRRSSRRPRPASRVPCHWPDRMPAPFAVVGMCGPTGRGSLDRGYSMQRCAGRQSGLRIAAHVPTRQTSVAWAPSVQSSSANTCACVFPYG